jgi:hypothetical protein
VPLVVCAFAPGSLLPEGATGSERFVLRLDDLDAGYDEFGVKVES